MSTFYLIYEATTKKLLDFKDIHKWTGCYQAALNKVAYLMTKTLYYTWQSIDMYFQVTMFMNIGPEYFGLILTIQKD